MTHSSDSLRADSGACSCPSPPGVAGEAERARPTTPSGTLSPAARAYLTELVAVMQEHSLNRQRIDWNVFRASVMTAAGAAQSVEQTFPAIRTALELLGDGRSVYRPVTGTPISVARACAAPNAGTPTLPATVGYVRVGSFSGSAAEATAFANAAAGCHRQPPTATAWPAGSSTCVATAAATCGRCSPVSVRFLARAAPAISSMRSAPRARGSTGTAEPGSAASLLQAVDTPYRLRRESPRVAVLIDGGTASSGEAIAIAFQRRPETRSFGTATCGLTPRRLSNSR